MQVTIVGLKEVSGISTKSGTPRPYKICHAQVIQHVEDSQRKSKRGSQDVYNYGDTVTELNVDETIATRLSTLELPQEGELILESYTQDGQFKTSVVDFRPSGI